MKKISFLLLLIVVIFVFTACSNETKQDDKFNIITSFYPIYIATSNLVDGVEDVSLECLASPEVGCLHDYQLTVNDMKKLENADVFVINGGDMESFLDKAISTYPELEIINSSETLLNIEEFHEEECEEDDPHHQHGEVNSHIWVSIPKYIIQVKNISKKLQELDPENTLQYIENENKYIQKLETLNKELLAMISETEIKNIVTFHEAFDYFAEDLDLNIVAIIEREPGTSPSARDLVEIIDSIRKLNVGAIFVEPQYLKTAANTIANETGVNVYELDPIVSGTFEKDAYENIMRKNISILKEALNND